ncbi:MAG: phosphotransferase [Pseudomonadota bacterium]
MFSTNRDLVEAAQAQFAAMAPQAQVDAGAYRMARHWIKTDANRCHIVALFKGPDTAPLVLKLAHAPRDATQFAGILQNHQAAMDATAAAPGITVPQLHAVDFDTQAYLMSFLPGTTFLDLCRQTADHGPLLRQAGRWLAAYHRGTVQQTRPFQPKFMARHMLHLVDQMDQGTRKIKGQNRFKRYAHAVQDLVEPCSGRDSTIAAKHGDLNAHNVIIADEQVAAYDFLPYSTAPVGYDIARFLVSYMQMEGDIAQVPNGAVLPPAVLDAFFEGYDVVAPNDPGVTFLLRIQILTDWNRKDHMASANALMRFQRLRAMAKRALG